MNEPLLFPLPAPSTRQPRNQRGIRHELEQFFTPFWAAERLVELFFSDLGPDDLVVDSGSGHGAFIAAVPAHVPAIAIEIDPALARDTYERTGRPVICGDFLRVELPGTPTVVIGNPPFKQALAFLDRCYELLPEDGRVGYIMDSRILSFCGPVLRLKERWSIRSDKLPRQLFPRARCDLAFTWFRKDRERRLYHFCLFEDAADVGAMPAHARGTLNRGRPHRSVWRALIEDALDALNGRATRHQIRAYIAGRRQSPNPFWAARVREILNNSGAFTEDSDGWVSRAA